MSFFLSKIEIVGWVAIPVGITLFFIRPRYLYYLTIFFIPFSATAVFNFQTKQVSIIIGTYWASLWILHEVILIIIKKKETRLPRITIFLFSFLSLCLAVSLFMPFFLEGKVQLYVFEKSVSEPLEFRPWHLMSFFYVVFGALVTIFVVIKNKDTRQLLASLRTYALS